MKRIQVKPLFIKPRAMVRAIHFALFGEVLRAVTVWVRA